MKMKIKNQLWLPLALLITMFLSTPISAETADYGEAADLGTIQVQLEQPTTPDASVQNVIFGLVKAASYDSSTGTYVLEPAFAQTNLDLNSIQTTEQLQTAADTLEKAVKDSGQTSEQYATNAAGTFTVGNLSDGIYLLYPINDSGYDITQAALIEIPQYNSETQTMEYTVMVFPKHAKKDQKPKPQQPAPQSPVKPNSPITGNGSHTAAKTEADLWILTLGAGTLLFCAVCLGKTVRKM